MNPKGFNDLFNLKMNFTSIRGKQLMTDQNQGEINLQEMNISNRSWLKKVGISLVILSCVFYGALLLVPFTLIQ